MKLYRDLPHNQHAVALAIGNFDGMHRGHQALVAATAAAARERGLDAAVMSFEPHPRALFAPASAPARLSSVREKALALAAGGILHLYLPRFNHAFAAQSPEAFLHCLEARLKVRWLMVGEDFRFGRNRAGNLETLRAWSAQTGCELAPLPAVCQGEQRIASTQVRAALAAGDFDQAGILLGCAYTITGKVVHGKKLGRQLGFPTANVSLSRRRPALSGVFAVRCRLARGLEGVAAGSEVAALDGVASLGTNPAVQAGGGPSLEVFLFDTSPDLYGQRLTVEFVSKLRDECRYDSLDALKAQIERDCREARLRLQSMAH